MHVLTATTLTTQWLSKVGRGARGCKPRAPALLYHRRKSKAGESVSALDGYAQTEGKREHPARLKITPTRGDCAREGGSRAVLMGETAHGEENCGD